MQARLRKLSNRVFPKNEISVPPPTKPRDKTLRHSRSMPRLGPEVFTGASRPVYKGRTPLKDAKIELVTNTNQESPNFKAPRTAPQPANKPVYKGSTPLKKAKIQLARNRDPMTASTDFTPFDSDIELEAPRPAPTVQGKIKANPFAKSVPSKHIIRQLPPCKPPPKQPLPATPKQSAYESDFDSGSEYSYDSQTAPPTPPPKTKFKRTPNDILNNFPSPPPLREVLKPVDRYDLPIEMQKDLLPPNPTTFEARYRAIKAREQKEREAQAQKAHQRSFSSNHAQPLPSRGHHPQSSLQLYPSLDLYDNGSSPHFDAGRKTARVYHAPKPSNSSNISGLSLDSNARLRDGPAAHSVLVSHVRPTQPRQSDPRATRPKMDYVSMSTGYMGPPPVIRHLDIRKESSAAASSGHLHIRKDSSSSSTNSSGHSHGLNRRPAMNGGASIGQTGRTSNDSGRPMVPSKNKQARPVVPSEFGHSLPSYPAVNTRKHGPSTSLGQEMYAGTSMGQTTRISDNFIRPSNNSHANLEDWTVLPREFRHHMPTYTADSSRHHGHSASLGHETRSRRF